MLYYDQNSTNVRPRSAYSPIDSAFREDSAGAPRNDRRPEPFGGKDYQVYINNIKVANLDTFTISSSVETVGQYAMGSQDALGHIQGKRALVGSMSMLQWDRHALIEEVFAMSYVANKAKQKDLWFPESAGSELLRRTETSYVVAGSDGTTSGVGAASLSTIPTTESPFVPGSSTARGMSRKAFDDLQRSIIRDAVRSSGNKFIIYADQLPAFDMTVVGINDSGAGAYTNVMGIKIMQETMGYSMSDMSGVVAFSFVALSMQPWRSLQDNAELAI